MLDREPRNTEFSSGDNVVDVMYFDSKLIKEIVSQSNNAICHLWEMAEGTFWRSTEERNKVENSDGVNEKFYPSVSYRSIEGLLDLMTYFPEWLTDSNKTQILETIVPKIFNRDIDEVKSSADKSGATTRNPFTISLYVVAISKVWQIEKAKSKLPSDSKERISSALSSLFDLFEPIEDLSILHPFIQFHILRATKIAQPILDTLDFDFELLNNTIVNSVRNDIESLLARHILNKLSPGDAVALIFCAAALALSEKEEVKHYILPALEIGFETQDSSGCWPLGRVIPEDKYFGGTKDFEISNYEIAWAASETLLRLSRDNRVSLLKDKASIGFERLLLACNFTRKSSVELEANKEPQIGWCSDPPYKKPYIESWTSATVLQSVISLQQLIEERGRESILKKFVTLDPRDEDWPSWLYWNKFKIENEPEDENLILTYLDRRVVEPIYNHPRKLPSANKETVSVLLFGPPGTGKTTIVQGVAEALNWPVVFLSPGDFIKEGLEYIEAQSRFVFDQLQNLSRAVVMFDECDELFRDRQPMQQSEQMRGITAFVTASMLPKLQDLHDRGSVLFFICTNKLETLDSAVKRSGRVDHIIGIGPPQSKYRARIIEKELESVPDNSIKTTLILTLTEKTERFIRKEIQRACKLLLDDPNNLSDSSNVTTAIDRIVANMENSLTIDKREYEKFNEQKKEFSRPVIEGRI